MQIRLDDLTEPEVLALVAEHLRDMRSLTPLESVHALDVQALRSAEITFWTAWRGRQLLGCGALKELDPAHGEIKSMRTVKAHRREGVARAMLTHIVGEARRRAYRRLSLETGSMPAYEAAQRLYAGFGFRPCPPFADYGEDPHSLYMTLQLGEPA